MGTGGKQGNEQNLQKLTNFIKKIDKEKKWHLYYRDKKKTSLDRSSISEDSTIGRTALYTENIKKKILKLESRLRVDGILNPPGTNPEQVASSQDSNYSQSKIDAKSKSILNKEISRLRLLNASLQKENDQLRTQFSQNSLTNKYMKLSGQIPLL